MLRLSSFITSLCTLTMFFAICAEVAGGRHTKRSSRIPVSIGPDGGPFAIPAWPVIVRILAVIDHSPSRPFTFESYTESKNKKLNIRACCKDPSRPVDHFVCQSCDDEESGAMMRRINAW